MERLDKLIQYVFGKFDEHPVFPICILCGMAVLCVLKLLKRKG